jgi:uncharacterized protein (DUF58 family)
MGSLFVVGGLLLVAALMTGVGVFYLLFYLVGGIHAVGWAWSGLIRRGMKVERILPTRVFIGETIPVQVKVINGSFLPVPWVGLWETLPKELSSQDVLRRATALRPRGEATVEYELTARKRGYYPVGPLDVQYGDVFGFRQEERWHEQPAMVVVYPTVVPITRLGLPSTTPLGTEKSTRILYQDPSRVIGAREYAPSDSPRMINWKVSAARGDLFVRQTEPAVSHEVLILLDLSPADYSTAWVDYASELAVTVAASYAAHLIEKRQSVGLAVNGVDQVATGGRLLSPTLVDELREQRSPFVPVGKSRRHLMTILELLARVGLLTGADMGQLLRQEASRLPWGSTLVVVTGRADEELLAMLRGRRQGGHNVLAVFTDADEAADSVAAARASGIAARAVTDREQLGADPGYAAVS